MVLFATKDILAHTNGILLSGSQAAQVVSSVVVDSRQVEKGSLFVALEGARVDGHSFLSQVAALGARIALVRRTFNPSPKLRATGMQLIGVDNPERALQDLAKAHLAKFPQMLRIGITGSCGKTTSKEVLSTILSTIGQTVSTPGNLNSVIGMPLALFGVDASYKFGIYEMGIDHPGEMDRLVHIFDPQIALMTNVGGAHLLNFDSREHIAREKARIFHEGLGFGQGFIHENNAFRSFFEHEGLYLRPCGLNTTPAIEQVRDLGLHGWEFMFEGLKCHLPLIGMHNLQNAIAALTIAATLGATPTHIQQAFESIKAMPGRSRVLKGAKGCTIIEDTYNANLESSSKIIDYVRTLAWSGQKHVVLGAMKELGEDSKASHQMLGRLLARMNPQSVYLYGEEMEDAYRELVDEHYEGAAFFTTNYSDLESHVLEETQRADDLVLLKGSRAMQLERLSEAMLREA